MRSHITTKGIERATHRALYYSMGFLPEDLDKPLIAVINTKSESIHVIISARVYTAKSTHAILRPGFIVSSVISYSPASRNMFSTLIRFHTPSVPCVCIVATI